VFSCCNNRNESLENYDLKINSENNPIFYIDFGLKTKSNHIYKTYEFTFYNDSIYSTSLSIFLRDNTFIAQLDNPKSNEFVLFDLKSEVNKKQNIEILNSKKIKSFESSLEAKVLTNQNLEVYIFRIKNWGKLVFPFDTNELDFIDLVVFVTKKYGVIGSYFSDFLENGEQVMWGIHGDILEEYLDYSKIGKVKLV